ncbi:MAG: hypothetical protein CMB82_11135 [Flammeovirgaceae bacterium]|nr:hypothetical protein [Flammeovirgaceae bacterium]|tara:strand:+ start:866 stop:1054 length:189 start_codon:yes stop_codon:yes gene_type:complete
MYGEHKGTALFNHMKVCGAYLKTEPKAILGYKAIIREITCSLKLNGGLFCLSKVKKYHYSAY